MLIFVINVSNFYLTLNKSSSVILRAFAMFATTKIYLKILNMQI